MLLKRYKKTIIILSFIGVILNTLISATSSNAQSFEQAYLGALETDKRLNSAISRFKASKFGVEEAYSERHPKFEGASNYDIVSEDNIRTRTFELTFNQPLYKFGYYNDLVKASKKNRDYVKNLINVLKQQIFDETAIVYTRILLNERLLEIELEREKDLKDQYEAIENEVVAGVKDEHQLDLINSYIAQAKVDKIKAENEIAKSHVQFKRITGITATQLDRDTIESYMQRLPDSEEETIVLARAFSPSLSSLKLDYERQNQELEKQKGVDLPSIDMYTRYQYGVSSGSDRDNVYFGFRLSLPIHRGGLSTNRNSKIDAEIEANEYNQTFDEKVALEEVVATWFDYKNGLREIELLNQATESSLERIEKLEQVLSADLQNLANFLEAKARYYDVYKSLIYTEYEQIVKGSKLLRGIGFAKLQ